MLGKVFRSRLVFLAIGLAIGAILLPMIPKGTFGHLLVFVKSQKVGMLVGVIVGYAIGKGKKGCGGFRIKVIRKNDDNGDDLI